jgi:hypothetical protein
MTQKNDEMSPVHAQCAKLFEKRTVAELTEDQMMAVDGGTGLACGVAIGVTLTLLYIMLK